MTLRTVLFGSAQPHLTGQKLAIDTSRRQQLEARLKVKREEEQVISDMVTAWKAKNVEIEEEEVAEAEALKKRNMDIRATQEKQIARRRELNRMERAERLGNDKEVIAQLEEDDKHVKRAALSRALTNWRFTVLLVALAVRAPPARRHLIRGAQPVDSRWCLQRQF